MLRPSRDAVLDRLQARLGARDLHVEVRPVDPLVQPDRLLVRRLRVEGEVRVDLDRDVAVLGVPLVDGREQVERVARRRAPRGGGRSPSDPARARAAPSAARRTRCPARSPSERWSGSRSRRPRRPLPSSASARRSRAGRARGSRSRRTAARALSLSSLDSAIQHPFFHSSHLLQSGDVTLSSVEPCREKRAHEVARRGSAPRPRSRGRGRSCRRARRPGARSRRHGRWLPGSRRSCTRPPRRRRRSRRRGRRAPPLRP